MFVFEKNPTSKLDKSGKVLIHCTDCGSCTLAHLWNNVEFCLKAKCLVSRCGIILQIFCENLVKKALSKIGCYVLLLARQNVKLKNSYILAKTGCLQPKLQDLKNYNIIFPL